MSTTRPRLELHLLGELRASIDNAPLSGRLYGKVMGLLAYLAVEGDRRHARERLAEIFWPDLPIETARTNLRQALYYLRRALDSAFLTIERDRVGLDPESQTWTDLEAFSSTPPECQHCRALGPPARCPACLNLLERRAALYRGPFLHGLEIADAPEFEEWRDRWREVLHRDALALHEALRAAHERRGDVPRALDHARRCISLQPWDEEGHRQLMRLLAADGQAAAALAHYAHCRAELERELDVEPEEATEALAQAIRAGGLAPKPHRRRQRRPVTALALAFEAVGDRDPEDVAELLHEPRRDAAALAERYGAHVVPTQSGGLIAYFGYPAALEDAGRRAARAALEATTLATGELVLRAGIHTGVIVSSEDPAFPDAAGLAPAAALRLAAQAQPGEVVADEATRKLTERHFSWHRRPAAKATYRLTADDDCSGSAPPLAGRQEELDWLHARWQQALRGKMKLVLIRGEAGLGKTRMVRALRETCSACSVRELYCYAEYQNTPLRPVLTLLEEVYRLETDDAPAVRLRKLVDALAQQQPDLLGLGASSLGPLLAPDDAAPEPLQPGHKQRLFELLLGLLDGLAQRERLLLVVEDVHWADASTLELLELLTRRQSRAPLLTVITARPSFHAPWIPPEAVLELAPLGSAELARLTESVAPELSGEAIADIVSRAQGVPLFAEELARAATDSTSEGVPLGLSYLLQARLDALGEAGRAAQLAAVLGLEFDRELLERVGDFEPAKMDALLAKLEAAELITPARGGYEFRHALIHEMVYASLLHIEARRAHARAANELAERMPRRAAQNPEQVARHHAAAGAPGEAVDWWLRAGRRAQDTLAPAEAASHLRRGLEMLTRLPEGEARDSLELELLLELGQALLTRHGYGSVEAAAVYDRAFDLTRHSPPSPARFQALSGLWMVSSSRSSYADSHRLAEALLAEAEALGDPVLRAAACSAAANSALWRGELTRACEFAETAVSISRTDAAGRVRMDNHEAQVASLAHLSWAHHAQGREDEALEASARAIEAARALDDPFSQCFALLFAATLRRFRYEVERAAELAREGQDLARLYRLPLWKGTAELVLGWGQACRGDGAALARMEDAVAAMREAMPGALVAGLHALADAQGRLGEVEAQLATTESALAAARKIDEHFHEADLHRMRGEALTGLGRAEEAAQAFAAARRIARRQGAAVVLQRLPARGATPRARS